MAAWRNVLPFPLGKWSWGGSCDNIYRAVLAMRRKPLLRLRNSAGAAGCGHVPKRVKVKNVPIRTVSSPRKSNIHFVVVFFSFIFSVLTEISRHGSSIDPELNESYFLRFFSVCLTASIAGVGGVALRFPDRHCQLSPIVKLTTIIICLFRSLSGFLPNATQTFISYIFIHS